MRSRREIARAQARSGAPPCLVPEQARAVGFPVPPRRLSEEQARYVMAEAIAVTQARITAWTRADLIRYLGETLPAGVLADRRTLETLAARAIGGAAGEQVELLAAPEWPRVPDGLRRADGESVFRPHGAERYASQAQLTLEEQLLAHAREPGAPRLDAEMAARLLGADPERLQAQLQPASAAAAEAGTAGSGLRMDQAVAAWYVLTSPRRAEVMVGPPGTGKTRTAIELARAWHLAGLGPVMALTASSNARNVLREEAARHGVAELACYNTAEWLGHAEGAREARDPIALAPGTLITLDEASMMSIGDLAAVLRRAAVHGAKVVVTGDPMQLQAVEGGGGMALLIRHLGHVQLSEASRFRHGWERQATLRLRDGDVTVLTDYRLHDRLRVGSGKEMLEDAARAYLHDRLAGKDTLLMAGTDARAAELARRVREDLIRWGIVSDGPVVRLRDGAQASTGDWIMARRNDAAVRAGQRGRTLVNRDILRITDTDPHGTGLSVQVVRLMGREESGRELWSRRHEAAARSSASQAEPVSPGPAAEPAADRSRRPSGRGGSRTGPDSDRCERGSRLEQDGPGGRTATRDQRAAGRGRPARRPAGSGEGRGDQLLVPGPGRSRRRPDPRLAERPAGTAARKRPPRSAAPRPGRPRRRSRGWPSSTTRPQTRGGGRLARGHHPRSLTRCPPPSPGPGRSSRPVAPVAARARSPAAGPPGLAVGAHRAGPLPRQRDAGHRPPRPAWRPSPPKPVMTPTRRSAPGRRGCTPSIRTRTGSRLGECCAGLPAPPMPSRC